MVRCFLFFLRQAPYKVCAPTTPVSETDSVISLGPTWATSVVGPHKPDSVYLGRVRPMWWHDTLLCVQVGLRWNSDGDHWITDAVAVLRLSLSSRDTDHPRRTQLVAVCGLLSLHRSHVWWLHPATSCQGRYVSTHRHLVSWRVGGGRCRPLRGLKGWNMGRGINSVHTRGEIWKLHF